MKLKRNIIVLLGCIAIASFGCSSMKEMHFKDDTNKTLSSNSIPECDEYIQKYKSKSCSAQFGSVQVLKANLVLKKAEEINTYESYAGFIKTYNYGINLNMLDVCGPDPHEEIIKLIRQSEKKAKKILRKEFVLGKKKPNKKNWQDFHIVLNSDFYNVPISKPPLTVNKHYIYTWDGKLTVDFSDYYIFKNEKGLFAVDKEKLRTTLNLSMNTWYIVIGTHEKNTKVTNILGEEILIPRLSVPLVFEYEKDFTYKEVIPHE
ncbi:hypothetical protein KJ966_24755 [bacterium]|nr:hypothetical protein [bacterium]